MNILAIETSCDETGVAILQCDGEIGSTSFKILGNSLFSQIEIHKEYGGVFPMMAKRAHAENLVPLLRAALGEAEMIQLNDERVSDELSRELEELLSREKDLAGALIELLNEIDVPKIDAITVTHGPGLEPTLWVGVNFAKALAKAWNLPLIPADHMEGHIFSALFDEQKIASIQFPLVALLASGGHTQLVVMSDWFSYEIIGETLDDAVGEAYDKVARMIGLPYPGGKEIDELSKAGREKGESLFSFPRPMLHSNDCNFSFSGLKTAVLYQVKDRDLSESEKEDVAQEFQDAVVEVLIKKTERAVDEFSPQTLLIGGGVAANKELTGALQKFLDNRGDEISLLTPAKGLSGDNAVMIGLAGYFRYLKANGAYVDPDSIVANGNLRLDK